MANRQHRLSNLEMAIATQQIFGTDTIDVVDRENLVRGMTLDEFLSDESVSFLTMRNPAEKRTFFDVFAKYSVYYFYGNSDRPDRDSKAIGYKACESLASIIDSRPDANIIDLNGYVSSESSVSKPKLIGLYVYFIQRAIELGLWERICDNKSFADAFQMAISYGTGISSLCSEIVRSKSSKGMEQIPYILKNPNLSDDDLRSPELIRMIQKYSKEINRQGAFADSFVFRLSGGISAIERYVEIAIRDNPDIPKYKKDGAISLFLDRALIGPLSKTDMIHSWDAYRPDDRDSEFSKKYFRYIALSPRMCSITQTMQDNYLHFMKLAYPKADSKPKDRIEAADSIISNMLRISIPPDEIDNNSKTTAQANYSAGAIKPAFDSYFASKIIASLLDTVRFQEYDAARKDPDLLAKYLRILSYSNITFRNNQIDYLKLAEIINIDPDAFRKFLYDRCNMAGIYEKDDATESIGKFSALVSSGEDIGPGKTNDAKLGFLNSLSDRSLSYVPEINEGLEGMYFSKSFYGYESNVTETIKSSFSLIRNGFPHLAEYIGKKITGKFGGNLGTSNATDVAIKYLNDNLGMSYRKKEIRKDPEKYMADMADAYAIMCPESDIRDNIAKSWMAIRYYITNH
jgi:hypothetical protein